MMWAKWTDSSRFYLFSTISLLQNFQSFSQNSFETMLLEDVDLIFPGLTGIHGSWQDNGIKKSEQTKRIDSSHKCVKTLRQTY